MANEIAALGLKVDADGVTSGVEALDDLAAAGPRVERAMAGVEQSTEKAVKSLKSLAQGSAKGLNDIGSAAPRAADSIGRLSKSAESANASLSKISSSAASAAVAYKTAGERISAYARAPEQAAVANQRLSKSMEATASAARLISSAFAISGIGLGASQIIALSDGYTKFTAQLRLATKSASEYGTAMESVQRIAYSAQAGISEIGTLYARIANGTAELGLSQQRLADITEVVALSLKVSGASAAESSSAMLQLSQAFASGVLRGEEFNAVNEAAPRLMKALADGIGVPIGALRKMAEEGQLTSKVLSEALPQALAKVRKEAEEIQTVGGAFTNLNSKMMEFIGGASDATGAANAVAKSVLLLADNLGVVTAAFGAGALVMTGRYIGALTAAAAAKRAAAVAAEASAIATTAASRAALAGSTSFQAMGASASTATIGVTAMAGATRAAGAALAFFGGPIGLAITALGVAASAFLYLRDSSEAAIKSIGGLNQPLDDLKKKIDDLPPEKKISILIDVEKSGKEAVRDAQKSIEDLTNFVRVFGNYTLPAEEVRKYTDELQKTAAAGGDLTPVLKRAAEAGQVPQKVLQRWLDLAANIREARAAATNAEAALAAAGNNVGGGRGTINPPTIAEMNASARAEAQSVLQATTAYKSKAEQIAEVQGQAQKLQAALNGLISTNQGTSKAADDLRSRLAGVDDKLKGLQKSTAAGNGAIKDTENAYKSLSNRVAEYIAQLQQEVAQGGKVTNSQKMQIQLDELLASSKAKVSKAALQALQNAIKTAAGLEAEAAAAADAAKAYEDGLKWKAEWYAAQGKNLEEIKSANDRIREEIQLIGLSQDAQQALERARIEATLAVREQHLAEIQRANDVNQFSSIEQQNLEMEIALLKERLGLLDDKRVRTANVEAAKELEAQWNKTSQTIGDTLADYIMGGGKDAAQYLKRLFSTLVLEPVVKTVVGGAMGGLGLGGSGAGGAGGILGGGMPGGSFTDWSSMGANAGDWLMTQSTNLGLNGMQGLGDAAFSLGNTINGVDAWLKDIPGMSGGIGSTLGYAGALYSLSQDNYGSAIGAGIGTYILPGIGTMIGSTLGGLVDGLFGGSPYYGGDAVSVGGKQSWMGKQGGGYDSGVGNFFGSYAQGISAVLTDLLKDEILVKIGFDENEKRARAYLDIYDTSGNIGVTRSGVSVAKGEEGAKETINLVAKEAFTQLLANEGLASFEKNLVEAASAAGGTYENLISVYSQIKEINAGFSQLGQTMAMFSGISDDTKTALLGAFGSIQGVTEVAGSFYQNFFSEEEKRAKLQEKLSNAFSAINLTLPDIDASNAREQYRALAEAQDLTTESGREAWAVIMQLGDAFASITPTMEEAAQAAKEALAAEAERAAQAMQEAAAAMAALRQEAMGIVDAQAQSLQSLLDGMKRQEQQVSGGYVGDLFLSGSEFTQFAGFADQLDGATQALEQLQALGLGDELKGYADQIGAIVQQTQDVLASTLSAQRLMAGDAAGAIAAAISASMPQYSDFTTDGNFNAGAFNAALWTERAKAASGLISTASADALNIPDVGGVLGTLMGDITTYGREVISRNLQVSGRENFGPLISGMLNDVYDVLTSKAETAMISGGQGLASVTAARRNYADTENEFNAFAKSIAAVQSALQLGRISAEDADKAIKYVKDSLGDLTPLLSDVAAQTARIANAALDLSSAGITSVGYYFDSLADSVARLNEQAAQTNAPLAQATHAIGLLDSMSAAFGQSAAAALYGAQAAIAGFNEAAALARDAEDWIAALNYQNQAASASGELTALLDPTSKVSRAQIVADAAAVASGVLTTASAAKAAEELAGKLVLGEGQSMRDLTLLVQGVGQYDNQGFYDAFARISDALGSGVISNEQYKTLFDYALGTYQGVSEEAKATASAFERLRDSMKSFADGLLIGDKTTLSAGATLSEMQRQYAEAFKSAADGDTDAIGSYQSLASSLLDKNLYSTQAEYNVAFGRTYGDARALEAQGAAVLAQQQNSVVVELKTLNESLSNRVQDLEQNLTAALAQIAKNTADTVKGVRLQNAMIDEGVTV